jgi:uncharacterized protein YydD (DUF2326 family)
MDEQIKQDIEKMKVAIEQMKAAGEDLFSEEIKNLQTKLENAEKELNSASEKMVEVVNQKEQSFVQKYGAGTARIIEIILLGVILYKVF